MLTVMELISLPLFKNFKLLTDNSGLLNVVSGTGIFDWESREDVEATFNAGEFVMTSLVVAKDNPTMAEKSLHLLIQKQVSAIAIKEVHVKTLSPELIDFANLCHVPIFFFRETFMDDLIYTVRNSLESDAINKSLLSSFKDILQSESDEKAHNIIENFNPFFQEKCICACLIPNESDSQKSNEIIAHFQKNYRELLLTDINYNKASHITIYGSGALMIIYTNNTDGATLNKEFLDFISNFNIDSSIFFLGISNPQDSFLKMRSAIYESIYSSLACIIENKTLLFFNNIKINQFLIPMMESNWFMNYFKKYDNILSDFDNKNNASLRETLIAYIKCDGNLANTGELIFQHSNTIRYRLKKIKELLDLDDSQESYVQLYTYVKALEISKLPPLDKLF